MQLTFTAVWNRDGNGSAAFDVTDSCHTIVIIKYFHITLFCLIGLLLNLIIFNELRFGDISGSNFVHSDSLCLMGYGIVSLGQKFQTFRETVSASLSRVQEPSTFLRNCGKVYMKRKLLLLLLSIVPRWLMPPNVLQPYWLIVLPLDVPDLTASLLLWGSSGQKWRCLWTFLFSNVPTFATSRLQEILPAKGGTTRARNGRWILRENARLPRNIQESFTCRKSTTWYRRLYFPSETACWGLFFALKNPTASVGSEPANLSTKGQHATSRPPKPLNVNLLMSVRNNRCSEMVFSTNFTLQVQLLFS